MCTFYKHLGSGVISKTPDHNLFKDLALTFSTNHKTMQLSNNPCGNGEFNNGITNGADWYVLSGGMQDFNYRFSNCYEITLELSCCKFPEESKLDEEWDNNKDSLVCYLLKVHQGIKGHVVDVNGNILPGAEIIVENNDKIIKSTERGEYWRLLLPGHYRVKAKFQDVESDYIDIDTYHDTVVIRNLIVPTISSVNRGNFIKVNLFKPNYSPLISSSSWSFFISNFLHPGYVSS